MLKPISAATFLWGFAAFAAPLFVTPAVAQTSCAPRAAMTERLARHHGEDLLAQGFASNGIVEFWVSQEQRGWTLLLTRPDGSSCILGAGEEWGPAPTAALPAEATGTPDVGL